MAHWELGWKKRDEREVSGRCRDLRTGVLGSPVSHLANFAVLSRVKEAFKGHIITDYVTILGKVTGQYNSHIDIDSEDHRRPGRPKDKVPWILISIHFIVPISLCSLKAKTIDFPFFCCPHSTLNSTDTIRFQY